MGVQEWVKTCTLTIACLWAEDLMIKPCLVLRVCECNSGFADVQTLLTQLMSYFNVITNPRAVFVTADTVDNGEIIKKDVNSRLNQLVDETLTLARKVSSS